MLQTLINDLQEKIRQSAEQLETLQGVINNALAEDKTGLFMTFCCQKYKEAAEKLRNNVQEVQNMQVILQEKKKRMHQLEELLQELTAERECAAEAFEALLVQYGFPHRRAYEEAALDKQTREALARVVEEYHRNVNANEKLVEHLEKNIVSREPMELQSLEEEILGLQTEKESALKKAKRWEQLLRELERTHREFCAKRQHLDALEREYGLVKELENIATGNNAKKLVFEQYVLAGYFEEILKAANIRFRKMTSGRYEMHRTREVGDGRVKDNLEIQVMDYYTGRHRSVRTLSGGESFKASLSLALGLSDVIQAMSGGIRVEALFIDEGFGALDSESLDQACETLLSLVESDRLIGIISHVPELRERIQKQIVIEKSANGSVLRVMK